MTMLQPDFVEFTRKQFSVSPIDVKCDTEGKDAMVGELMGVYSAQHQGEGDAEVYLSRKSCKYGAEVVMAREGGRRSASREQHRNSLPWE
jgi:hypothetical protein